MRDLIDLDRYPLDRPESAGFRALVDRCRADLAAEGMFDLPGFLRPEAVAKAVAELQPVFASDSFTHARHHNIHFRKDIDGLPPDYPALKLFQTSVGV